FFLFFYRVLRDLHSFPTRRSSDLHCRAHQARRSSECPMRLPYAFWQSRSVRPSHTLLRRRPLDVGFRRFPETGQIAERALKGIFLRRPCEAQPKRPLRRTASHSSGPRAVRLPARPRPGRLVYSRASARRAASRSTCHSRAPAFRSVSLTCCSETCFGGSHA